MLLVIVAGASLPAFSQQITGSIVGTVKDPQGAVVSSANVKATNTNTGFARTVPTNGYGEFRIDYLPVGNYTVEVSAPNFKKFVQKNIVLTVDQTQTLEVPAGGWRTDPDRHRHGSSADRRHKRRGDGENDLAG